MAYITYSLKNDHDDSNQYYKNVSAFTDEVLAEAEELILPMVDAFRNYMITQKKEKMDSREEYILEFLVLGVLWHVYSGDALNLAQYPGRILSGLADFRRKSGSLKPGVDFLKGILSTLFLSPDLYDNMFLLEPDTKHLYALLNWLEASGEFSREVKRLKVWQQFLESMHREEASDYIATALTFGGWFESRSVEVLGGYTCNVDHFLNEVRPKHYWKEDVIFCGRRRVEYHLNMVGAEIMNRAFREEFVKTPRKAVFLPGCMRILPESVCPACVSQESHNCRCCSDDCNVSRIKKLGNEHGFQVYVFSHESAISGDGLDSLGVDAETGVIGVSCILNLISGGWMLKDLDIPAQCVLLEYCGCRNHWHETGIPTEINTTELLDLLEVRKEDK